MPGGWSFAAWLSWRRRRGEGGGVVGNNAPTPPRPDGASLRCHRRDRELLYRSPGLDLRRLSGDVVPALLLQGCGMCCGCCGWWPAGSGSIFPRRRWSSTASSDSGAGGVGARPRSMGDRRRLHPVFKDGCLLRLLSKPVGDGALPVHGGARRLRRQRRLATTTPSAGGALWI